jgi:hypothetical protein
VGQSNRVLQGFDKALQGLGKPTEVQIGVWTPVCHVGQSRCYCSKITFLQYQDCCERSKLYILYIGDNNGTGVS